MLSTIGQENVAVNKIRMKFLQNIEGNKVTVDEVNSVRKSFHPRLIGSMTVNLGNSAQMNADLCSGAAHAGRWHGAGHGSWFCRV
jgi:hypothetical protein